ncbi:MAG: hypothetical protein P4M07_23075 [Xanthobacteraceae bacterium]|nr:hypothetical protein [Xanthobacteraceae bacterium]
MPRIRTIKPEFPQSETIGRLTREARLLFLQLFTLVDDAGRARAPPRMLASLLYPYDDDAAERIDGWLDELVGRGLVVCYETGGARYLAISHWTEHQKIDRPTPSRLPAPPGDDDAATAREASRGLAADLDSESDPESESGSADAVARAFDAFWQAYPRRGGANPREPARRKFRALVAEGIDPAAMIAAAKRLAVELAASQTAGTRFVPQALTFLAQHRFADEAAAPPSEAPAELDVAEAVKLYARTGHWSRFAGPAPGLAGCRAPPDLLARHGLAPDGRPLIPASPQRETP